jgi:hypothetical protein
MKYIELTKGKCAIVDDEDFDRVNQFKWKFDGYANRIKWVSSEKRYVCVYMHRFIINTPAGFDTDHINGDKLDNRKSNLRAVSHSVNLQNRRHSRKNTSGYRGVCWDKSRNKWMAFINYRNKHITLGRFDDIIEAAKAYNKSAKELYKGTRWLNRI